MVKTGSFTRMYTFTGEGMSQLQGVVPSASSRALPVPTGMLLWTAGVTVMPMAIHRAVLSLATALLSWAWFGSGTKAEALLVENVRTTGHRRHRV